VTVSSATKPISTLASPKLGTAELLFRSAQKMGLQPSWIIPDGLFAVLVNGQERYVNFAHSPLNSQISASLAKNKHLTRQILERHDMPNIPFINPQSHTEASLFLDEHGKIIAKPVSGSGSRDIHIVAKASQLEALDITKYILEKYITGQELRYLVLNGEVIAVHRSDYGTSVQEDRPLERISYHPSDWDQTLVLLAVQVAQILGLKFATVDYLVDSLGRAYILEVNTTPGLKWFHAPTSGPIIDVAHQLLNATFRIRQKEIPAVDEHS
jgi:glutathione synthase/RimK-type ligase-like ATP-grasp enzyme